ALPQGHCCLARPPLGHCHYPQLARAAIRTNALDQTCSSDGAVKINQHEIERGVQDLPVTVVRIFREGDVESPLIERTPQRLTGPVVADDQDSLLHRGDLLDWSATVSVATGGQARTLALQSTC